MPCTCLVPRLRSSLLLVQGKFRNRFLATFLLQVLYLAFEDLDRAPRRFQEQGALRGEVGGPPLQSLPEAFQPHEFAQRAVQGAPVVEDGGEALDAAELETEVRQDGAQQPHEVRVVTEYGADGGDLAARDLEDRGVEVGAEADAEEDEVRPRSGSYPRAGCR